MTDDKDKRRLLSRMIGEYASLRETLDQRDRAARETAIYDLARSIIPDLPMRRVWLRDRFGGTSIEYEARFTLHYAKDGAADPLWPLVLSGEKSIGWAARFLMNVRNAWDGTGSLKEAVERALGQGEGSPTTKPYKHHRIGVKGILFDELDPENTKALRSHLRKSYIGYVAHRFGVDLRGDDPLALDLRRAWNDFESDLDNVLDDFVTRLSRLKGAQIREQAVEEGSSLAVLVDSFTAACSRLCLEPPTSMKGCSPARRLQARTSFISAARKSKKRGIRAYHPDNGGGSDADTVEALKRVQDDFKYIDTHYDAYIQCIETSPEEDHGDRH